MNTHHISLADIQHDPAVSDVITPEMLEGEESAGENNGGNERETQPTQQTSVGESQQQEPTQTQPQTTQQLTPEQIQQIVAAAREGMAQPTTQQQTVQKQPVQQERQYTQAELDKLFNKFTATPEIFQKIFGYAPENSSQVAALQETLDGVAKHVLTIQGYQRQHYEQKIEEAVKALKEEMMPAYSYAVAQQDKQIEQEFFKEYPQLANYRDLLKEIKDTLVAQKVKFQTKDEAFKVVAGKATALINAALGKTNISPMPNTQQQQTRKMQATGDGGHRGGSSVTAAQSQKRLAGMEVFD